MRYNFTKKNNIIIFFISFFKKNILFFVTFALWQKTSIM